MATNQSTPAGFKHGASALASETRERVLQSFERSRQDVLSAISGLSDSQMRDSRLDEWSVLDVLSHLAFWHELRYFDIQRLAAGYVSAYEMTAPMGPDREGALCRLPSHVRGATT